MSMLPDGSRAEEPQVEELKRQLDRMLSSRVFATRSTLSRFLRHIVSETIRARTTNDDSQLREHTIGFELLDNYDANNGAVRTNVTLLRQQIKKYYIELGLDDLVKIDVPVGGYRASFQYNRASSADTLYRQGCLLKGGYADGFFDHPSLRHFVDAVNKDPNHALAYVAVGEAEFYQAVYRRRMLATSPAVMGEQAAQEAIRLQPELWRAHMLQAAVHCCRYEWQKAEVAFAEAIRIAPIKAREHPFYTAYLLATGNHEEALTIVEAVAKERPESVDSQVTLALFLYVTRQYDRADDILETLVRFARDKWLAVGIQGLVMKARWNGGGKHRFYSRQLKRSLLALWPKLDEINDEDSETNPDYSGDILFPGIFCLLHSPLGVTLPPDAIIDPEDPLLEGAKFEDLVVDARLRRFVAKALLSHARALKHEATDSRDWWIRMFGLTLKYWTIPQVALAQMAMGKPDDAIAELRRAQEEGDPFTVWLHLWPVLDPLREHPEFQSLIADMNLP